MKKFYAFLAAALMSAFAFASKDVVPSDEVLQGYYDEGKVCVCFFVPADMACNDIVLTGSFNGWKGSAADCVPTEPVEGYDGWYVGSFEPEAEPSATDGICAKPVMLDVDGNFHWEYQVGAATAIRGGVQVVEGAYAGEIDMKHYGTDAPNVFTVDAWKQNPCDAVYHVYTITVISDGCGGLAVPYVVGGMNGWAFERMQLDVEKTMENMVPTYVYTNKMAEKTPYQVVAGLLNAETGEIEVEPGWNDDSYLQKLIDEQWVRIPGEEGDNLLTHEDPNILFDLRAEDLRWARCAPPEPAEVVAFSVKLPTENIPAAVEVIGGFDDWQGTALTWNPSTDFFEATFEAKASQFFKFRSAGIWPPEGQEIELYDTTDDAWRTIKDNELVFGQLWEDAAEGKSLVLDLSDPESYRWSAVAQGIENITLTEKAQKVVVDGVLYIVRDNKMFNAQGTQVR